MDKKYILTNEMNEAGFYRIVALRDIPRYGVKAGDLGGFVGSEKNLSQEDDAWVSGNACVFDDACVSGNAQVFGNTQVYENAHIYGNAQVFGKACIYGNAEVFGCAHVFGKSWVESAARIYGYARISGSARVSDNAHVYDNAHILGDACVSGHAHVSGNVCVGGYAAIFGDARVSSGKDYIVFKNWWSSERYFTWTRSNNMWKVGCFYGTGKELVAKAEKDSELSGREYRRVVEYVESILKDEKNANKKKTIHRDSKGRFCKSK